MTPSQVTPRLTQKCALSHSSKPCATTSNSRTVTEKDIGALGDGHVHRLCIMLLLARKTQIAARADICPLSRPDPLCVLLKRVLQHHELLRPYVVSTYTPESAHLAHARDDLRNFGETVCAVPREFLGWGAEATSGGLNRSGRPRNSLKPMKRADQFAICMQWST